MFDVINSDDWKVQIGKLSSIRNRNASYTLRYVENNQFLAKIKIP